MRHFTRLSLLAAVVLGAAAFTSPAFARPSPVAFPNTVGSTHFLVHYQSDVANTRSRDHADAGRRHRRRTPSAPIPPSSPTAIRRRPPTTVDGDPRIDIYVDDLSSAPELSAYSRAGHLERRPTPATSCSTAPTRQARSPSTRSRTSCSISIQFGIWLSCQTRTTGCTRAPPSGWGTASTATPATYELGPHDMSLDCRDPLGATTGMQTRRGRTSNNGYSRWPFFEYLAEKYGASFMQGHLHAGPAAQRGDGGASDALAAKGTTLARHLQRLVDRRR